jgi:formate dehydrogenase maturation protein FdhE
MIAQQWDRRIQRANELASSYPFAAEGLNFYSRVAAFQRSLNLDLQHEAKNSPWTPGCGLLREELDLVFLLSRFPAFLSLIREIAPPPVARAAIRLQEQGPNEWQRALEDYWQKGAEHPADLQDQNNDHGNLELEPALDRFLAWIFLQPYAEFLASRRGPTALEGTPSICPLCGARPVVGVLRPEGDGAKKSLICVLCAHEWAFRRIYCPACGEEREPQMAFYSAPEIPHVRVDVCDTCHTYLKSVDLTKAGLAVPVVDELATIPLDLWAREHGYTKLQMNLLGT